jgi:hypothetical protein
VPNTTTTQNKTKQNRTNSTFIVFSPVLLLHCIIEFVSNISAMAENQSQTTTSNTPSEPVLCKLGCGFFVSIYFLFYPNSPYDRCQTTKRHHMR